jgi:predicted porin
MQLKRCFKLAALAAAAGLTAGAAQAQSSVTLYGQVDAWAGMTKNLGASDRAAVVNSGGMSTSYWGMKGSEDLGNGLKAIFTLEAFFRPDTGKGGRFDGDTFFARNSFVGLHSNTWGYLYVGMITRLYFF